MAGRCGTSAADVTAASESGGALSDVASSRGSKMRGRASDDMVPSVASSWDRGTTVPTVIDTLTESVSGCEASEDQDPTDRGGTKLMVKLNQFTSIE